MNEETTSRAAFQAWAKAKTTLDLTRDGDDYARGSTTTAWVAWQAALNPCAAKDPRGCWNVRCQLGNKCCSASDCTAEGA